MIAISLASHLVFPRKIDVYSEVLCNWQQRLVLRNLMGKVPSLVFKDMGRHIIRAFGIMNSYFLKTMKALILKMTVGLFTHLLSDHVQKENYRWGCNNYACITRKLPVNVLNISCHYDSDLVWSVVNCCMLQQKLYSRHQYCLMSNLDRACYCI